MDVSIKKNRNKSEPLHHLKLDTPICAGFFLKSLSACATTKNITLLVLMILNSKVEEIGGLQGYSLVSIHFNRSIQYRELFLNKTFHCMLPFMAGQTTGPERQRFGIQE